MTSPSTSTTEKQQNHHNNYYRRLAAEEFRAQLEAQVPPFLTQIIESLQSEYQIDVSTLQADHVCWRTESLSEYKDLVDSLLAADSNHDFQLLIESEIGGRPIATFQLSTPIIIPSLSETRHHYHQVQVIEIPSPKDGSPYSRGLEHVEFVIGDGRSCTSPWNDEHHQSVLEDFQKKHRHVKNNWNTKAINKKINPDISVKLTLSDFGVCSAKFHLLPLADVIAAEKAAAAGAGEE